MNTELICHFLIGLPAAGKSTFAGKLSALTGCKIISTDAIRLLLYGDETVQGNWDEIEAEVFRQIQESLAIRKPIIYDATNVRRAWRMGLLMKLSQQLTMETQWMAWYLQTPLDVCLQRNQQRQKTVPEEILTHFYQALQSFPPVTAEGFVKVVSLKDSEFDRHFVEKTINSLSRNCINRQNRTQNSTVRFHSYSHLLDFDRLLHLISLFIHYPGLGSLQETHPEKLQELLRTVPVFSDSLAEITEVMKQVKGDIYADREALTYDLKWLQTNGLIGKERLLEFRELHPIQVELSDFTGTTHAYSDLKPFKRLMTTIRLILIKPFLQNQGQGSLKALAKAISEELETEGDCYNKLRKDIENILKPFQILPEFSLKTGYFAGTGILSHSELKQIYGILQAHAKSIEDPVALDSYQLFSERMAFSHLEESSPYPVRAIGHRCMVNSNYLHSSVLLCNLRQVEEVIERGELVKLGRCAGRGRFPGDKEDEFLAWPLQIVFYRFAWYLGFEHEGGSQPGLLRFERLDRLFLVRRMTKARSRKEQEISLRNLQRLLEASPVIFLGRSAIDQQKFLNPKKAVRSEVEVQIELWFDDETFRFISEGTKRFPLRQMKMSPPLSGRTILPGEKSLFSLPRTGDSQFPNRFRVVFPRWSLQDFDLWSWILSFGGQVKVIKPQELIDIVRDRAESIVKVYQS